MKSWELKATTTGPNTIKFQEREQLIPIDYQGSRDERKKERKYKGRAVLTYHREVNLLISGWTIFVIHPAPVHPHVGRLEGIDLQFRGFYARPHGRPFTEHVWIWPKLRLSYRFAASVQAVYRLAAPLVFVPKNHAHHLAPAHRIDVARYLSFETSHRRHIQHRYWKITPNIIRPTPFTKETIIWRLFGVIFRKLRMWILMDPLLTTLSTISKLRERRRVESCYNLSSRKLLSMYTVGFQRPSLFDVF